jgi:chromosomal replication initiator protein
MASSEQLETFTYVYREHGLDAAIDSVSHRQPPAPACSPFLRRVCEALEVTPQQLLHGGRCKSLANARHIAMWVCREATGASYPEIGKALGGMHHTSVMHGVRRVESTPRLLEQARAILARTPGFTFRVA